MYFARKLLYLIVLASNQLAANGAFLLPIKWYHLEFQGDNTLFPIDFNLLDSRVFHIKINWNYNFVGLLHHPFWLQLVWALSDHCSQVLNFFV